ncbi:hypothetical protein SAMN05192588_1102 [Nonlabens sp. Hel1_33_55]|uniref:hypothetical protein n=1 Tax=Nonlabens sp. Hel1_33_55 TaxID=1336802 RepID=UPI000875DBEA|nr:hypothetical protein [Nonlabens sp. Hel1_33_55]SCY09228.1 hypothetical protein SAMN05192588_1102 [Nonlabens sp. Hel1_33_55]
MNKLLEKYWEGDTSLQEEQELRDYFNSDQVAPEHLVYKGLFHSYEMESSIEVDGFDAFAKVKSQQHHNKRFNRRTWTGIAVAASVSLMVAVGSGIYDNSRDADLGTYDSPEEAYDATVAALELVSNKFNKGTRNLEPMTELNKQTSQVFNINQ